MYTKTPINKRNGVQRFKLTNFIKKKLRVNDFTPFPITMSSTTKKTVTIEEFWWRNLWGWWDGGTWIPKDHVHDRERLCRQRDSYSKHDEQDIGEGDWIL